MGLRGLELRAKHAVAIEPVSRTVPLQWCPECQYFLDNVVAQRHLIAELPRWNHSTQRNRTEDCDFLPDGMSPQHARPIRSENRATLVASIARGRRWLDELLAEETATTDSIAERVSRLVCRESSISRCISG